MHIKQYETNREWYETGNTDDLVNLRAHLGLACVSLDDRVPHGLEHVPFHGVALVHAQ